MAQAANTFETFNAVGIRETLSNVIAMITPEETPFLSAIGRRSVDGTHPEWQNDALATPDTDNNQPEGNEWNYQAITPTSRVGTYCQISDKRIVISGTLEEVKKAGRESEVAREVRKKGVELRIDREVIALSNQASSAGAANAASNRKTAGLRAIIATNDLLGSGGASGGFNTSTGIVDAATNGTQRALTKALLDQDISAVYTAGGNPTMLMVSPYAKTVFSSFMSDANVAPQRYETPKRSQTTIVAAAETYLSDFGTINVVPNRQMARAGASVARNAFLLEPDKLAQGFLRSEKIETPAKTGDNTKKVILTEWCLLWDNEAAQGVIADIFGMTSSS
jgi:hypothetical protein